MMNRKLRRKIKAFQRRKKQPVPRVNWFKRIVKEMKDNAYVIERVASGVLDKKLGIK